MELTILILTHDEADMVYDAVLAWKGLGEQLVTEKEKSVLLTRIERALSAF